MANSFEVLFHSDGEVVYSRKIPGARTESWLKCADDRYRVIVNASDEDAAEAAAYAYLIGVSEEFRKSKKACFGD